MGVHLKHLHQVPRLTKSNRNRKKSVTRKNRNKIFITDFKRKCTNNKHNSSKCMVHHQAIQEHLHQGIQEHLHQVIQEHLNKEVITNHSPKLPIFLLSFFI